MQKRRKYCARAARVQRFSLQFLSNQYYSKSAELIFHQFPAVFVAAYPLRMLPAYNFQHADKKLKMTKNAKKSIAGSYPTPPTRFFPTFFQNQKTPEKTRFFFLGSQNCNRLIILCYACFVVSSQYPNLYLLGGPA